MLLRRDAFQQPARLRALAKLTGGCVRAGEHQRTFNGLAQVAMQAPDRAAHRNK